MYYVTMLWSGIAAAALVLGAIHVIVWALDRRELANLTFAVSSFGLVGVALCETGMMAASSAAQWATWVRWFQVPNFFMVVGALAFIRLYLGVGRIWLFGTFTALRLIILLMNFAVEPNFNFDRVDSIAHVSWLGQSVAIVDGAEPSRWQWVATLSTILSVVYILDAAWSAWRVNTPESRRRALVIGGGWALFFIPAVLNTQLIIWGWWRSPTLIAPAFLMTIGTMAFELSRDTLRASGLARELRRSERALQLAASAGGFGLWSWSAHTGRVWATDEARSMFSLDGKEPISISALAEMINPEDIERVHDCLRRARQDSREHEIEFRICRGDASVCWILARGRAEFEPSGQLARLRGIVRDVTEQHRTLQELEELRANLTHSSRVTALGHLSTALAHELRQPLVAVQSNIEAAHMLLRSHTAPDLAELREILTEIRRDNRRASDIIDRMRALMKQGMAKQEPVPMNDVIYDVIALVRSDAHRRGVTLETHVDGARLTVRGDRVHLSQVLINLLLNAMDAMSEIPQSQRRVKVRAGRNIDGSIEVSVSDHGAGIPADKLLSIFEPFFTTKGSGMGLGLFVCRTIVEAHRGKLSAENNATGGAMFRLTLPALDG